MKESKLLYLFSLRKNGGICTFPHVKYPDKDKIKNRLAYNLIKEVNMVTLPNNKFSLLFEHQSTLTKLYHSSLKYGNVKLTGFCSLRNKNEHINLILEEDCMLSMQIMREEEDKKFNFMRFPITN